MHSGLGETREVAGEVHRVLWVATAALKLQAPRLVMVEEEARDHDSAVQEARFVRTVEGPQISARQLFLPQRASLVVGVGEEAQLQGQAHARVCQHRL